MKLSAAKRIDAIIAISAAAIPLFDKATQPKELARLVARLATDVIHALEKELDKKP